MRILLLWLALAGCAASATGLEQREQAALDRDLAGRTAGEARSCITSHSAQALQSTGTGTFVYRDGATIWVNQPIHPCRGMRPLDTLIIETHGSRYCRGDRVRSVEPGGSIPGPMCVLGDFIPYRRPS